MAKKKAASSETPKAKKRSMTLKRLGKLIASGELQRIPREEIPDGVVVSGLRRRIVIETDGDRFNVVEADVAGTIELVAILRMMLNQYQLTEI